MFAIQVKNVNLNIRKRLILKNISFTIPKGKISVFVGENGAGKSSTIRAIFGLEQISSGSIKIFNKSVSDYSSRNNVALVPDTGNFLSISVRQWIIEENKFFGLSSKTIIQRVNKLFRLLDLDIQLLDKHITQLSSGFKKMAMIISAIVSERKLIIMDEPTEFLDPIMKKKFFILIHKYNKMGIGFFISTHNLTEISSHINHLTVIKNGEIAFNANWTKNNTNLQQRYEKFYESNDAHYFN